MSVVILGRRCERPDSPSKAGIERRSYKGLAISMDYCQYWASGYRSTCNYDIFKRLKVAVYKHHNKRLEESVLRATEVFAPNMLFWNYRSFDLC